MIWLEAWDTYVFYDRFSPSSGVDPVTATLTSAEILRGPLRLLLGASPDNRVAESPPDGRVEPVSGFGLVWRGEVASSAGIRARLGWALEPEAGFYTRLQCEVPCGTDRPCYVQDAQGRVLRIAHFMHVGYVWEPTAILSDLL